MENKINILVSACLLGYNCKYNGFNNYNNQVSELSLYDNVVIHPVCPEMDGGLTSPRKPCEIICEKVVTKDGDDYTQYYKKGALIALEVAKDNNCKIAVLKAKSPSCGYKQIYDGTFSHNLISGNGVACNMLLNSGVKIYTEEDVCLLIDELKK